MAELQHQALFYKLLNIKWFSKQFYNYNYKFGLLCHKIWWGNFKTL